MKFSDILKAANNAWGFAWPPIVALTVVFFVTDFVSAFSLKDALLDGLGGIREKTEWLKEVKSMLNEYGLAKVLTVFAGVLLVVVLYLIKHVGLPVAGLLPPYVEISKSDLALRVLPETEIVRLFRHYPGAMDFAQAYQWGATEFAMSKPGPVEKNESVGGIIGQLAKLGALTAIVVELQGCLHSGLNVGIFKCLVVQVIAAVVWLATVLMVLGREESEVRRIWFGLRKSLLADSSGLAQEDLTAEEIERARKEKARAAEGTWWKLRFLKGRSLAWFRSNVMNR